MNKMNEISFVCPEIGRWSTVGGLGVMVNELSEGLAAMGEKISVVSPYYDKNRKG
jgi:starch synthase